MTLRRAAVAAVASAGSVRRWAFVCAGAAAAAAVASASAAWDPWGTPPAPKPAASRGLAGETNAARIAALIAIRAYQHTVSRALPGGCQFQPSCSTFTFRCIASHGLINGTWMGADRISRCHGFAALGGYPVSPSGSLVDPPEDATPPLAALGVLGL